MRYEGQIYRPPGEWRSYLLQCTIGCSHNKCTFCGMYKDQEIPRAVPMKEIIEDIAMAREYYGPENVDNGSFSCDGDAIVMTPGPPAADSGGPVRGLPPSAAR